jgi:aminoglycoside phosphotransferase (APT) family kinase protein
MTASPPAPGEETLRALLARFPDAAADAARGSLRAPAHASLAFVWFVADRWVLRGRVDGPAVADELGREQALLERVRPLLPYALPTLRLADAGVPWVRHGGFLWTVHAALPGEVLFPWQALEDAPDDGRRRLLRLLRELHDRTRGRLGAGDPGAVVRTARANAARLGDRLSAGARKRLDKGFARVMYNAVSFELADLAFVHGDFHYGNLLLDEAGRATGLIDLDWARIAHPFEDLGYTAMMLVRRTDGRPHRVADLERIWAWYGGDEALRILYPDYVLFFALFDVVLFLEAASLPDRERYVRAQLALVEALAAHA